MRILLLIIGIGLSTFSQAADLVFKNGFENSALVSGSAAGLSSSTLILTLNSGVITEDLSLNTDGAFVFFAEILVGAAWSVSISQLPTTPQQQTCELNNESGVMPAIGADTLTINCDLTAWNWDEMDWDEGGWN